jgi:hypothetical protein
MASALKVSDFELMGWNSWVRGQGFGLSFVARTRVASISFHTF